LLIVSWCTQVTVIEEESPNIKLVNSDENVDVIVDKGIVEDNVIIENKDEEEDVSIDHEKNDSVIAEKELTIESMILRIREIYADTNSNIGKYTKIEEDIVGESAEWGVAVYYKDWDIYKKIVTTYFWEMGKSIYELYFDLDGWLVFVFEQNYDYNRPIYQDAEMALEFWDEAFDFDKSIISENRYYYFENTLIKWIDNDKKEIDVRSDKFLEKQWYFVKYSQELIK